MSSTAPAKAAPSSTPKVVGKIEFRDAGDGKFEIRGEGNVNGRFYVDRYMAEAAIELLKASIIKKAEDTGVDQEVCLVNLVNSGI